MTHLMLGQGPIAVYGHVGFDISTIDGRTSHTPGGAAYYASKAAAAHGATVHLVTILGDDFPEAHLCSSRIRLASPALPGAKSATFHQVYNSSGDIVHFEAYLNACEALTPDLILASAITPAAVFIATMPPRRQAEALGFLGRSGYNGTVAIDTALVYVDGFREVLRDYGAAIDVVFMNKAESVAVGVAPVSGGMTVIKRGSKGAALFQEGKWLDVPGTSAKPVVTLTGAGDVLAGAFLARIATGITAELSLVHAVEFASAYVQSGVSSLGETPIQSGEGPEHKLPRQS